MERKLLLKKTWKESKRLSSLAQYDKKPCLTNSNLFNTRLQAESNMEQKLKSESKDLLKIKD